MTQNTKEGKEPPTDYRKELLDLGYEFISDLSDFAFFQKRFEVECLIQVMPFHRINGSKFVWLTIAQEKEQYEKSATSYCWFIHLTDTQQTDKYGPINLRKLKENLALFEKKLVSF